MNYISLKKALEFLSNEAGAEPETLADKIRDKEIVVYARIDHLSAQINAINSDIEASTIDLSTLTKIEGLYPLYDQKEVADLLENDDINYKENVTPMVNVLPGKADKSKIIMTRVLMQDFDNRLFALADQRKTFYAYELQDNFCPLPISRLRFDLRQLETCLGLHKKPKGTKETHSTNKTIAMLSILLAKHNSKFKIGERPNASAIKTEVITLLETLFPESADYKSAAYGLESIDKKIGDALDTLADKDCEKILDVLKHTKK